MLIHSFLPRNCCNLFRNTKAPLHKPSILARSVSLPEQKTASPGLRTRSRRRSRSRSRSPSPAPQREASLPPLTESQLNIDALSQEGELLCCQLIQARRFQSNVYGGKLAPYDDMLLAGIIGLVQAAKRFQPPDQQQQQQQQPHQPRAARFLSYAHSYIQKSIREACNGMNEVYIPR
eukprot:1154559-Pelagomonas_calceolata.AAC.7